MRRNGIADGYAHIRCGSFRMWSIMLVSKGPGARQFTRMPWGASFTTRSIASEVTVPLLAS